MKGTKLIIASAIKSLRNNKEPGGIAPESHKIRFQKRFRTIRRVIERAIYNRELARQLIEAYTTVILKKHIDVNLKVTGAIL